MDRLSGKVAIVTGAGQGIGRGIALAYGREGASVVLVGRTEQKITAVAEEMLAAGLTALPVPCDVTDPDGVRATVAKTVKRFGTIDILVNNAATGYDDGDPSTWPAFEDTPVDYLNSVMNTNVVGPMLFMQACFPYLKKHGGKIINMGTGGSSDPHLGSYVASKEALRGLSRVAAREWGKYGITVNLIAPFGLSPILKNLRERNPAHYEEWMSRIPLGRAGDCEQDIAPVAVFLASEDSRYVTGHMIMVDGGMGGRPRKQDKPMAGGHPAPEMAAL